MVAVTDTSPDTAPAAAAVDGDAAAPARNIGIVLTASLLTGAAIAAVWFWIPLTVLIIGVSSIPSGIGFALCAVVFIYLMRGVEHVERVRSEAVFGLGIGVPPRRVSPYTGFQRWLHQLWLDVSSARFWKSPGRRATRRSEMPSWGSRASPPAISRIVEVRSAFVVGARTVRPFGKPGPEIISGTREEPS